MKAIFSFVLCALVHFAALSARGDILTTNLHTEYVLNTEGHDSTGTRIAGTVSFNSDDDLIAAGVGDEFTDHNDLASVMVHATAVATHRDNKKFLGVIVSGSLNASRPAYNPAANFPSQTGNLIGTASALAEYNDSVIFDGTSFGQMHVRGFVRVPGTLKSDATRVGHAINASASAGVILSGTGMFTIIKNDFITTGGSEDHPPVDVVNEFSYDLSPLQPTPINFRLEVRGVVVYGGSDIPEPDPGAAMASFSADFSKTLEWGGITSVTDRATGLPITDWTVTSASGFDYTQFFGDVPEPSSVMLLLIGVVTVVSDRVYHRALGTSGNCGLRIAAG